MLNNNGNQRKRILLQAVRLIGGETVLADLLEVDQSTLNKWINLSGREIPYDKALLIEKYTGIPVELLCPKATKTNRYLRDHYVLAKLMLHPVMKKQIVIGESFCGTYLETDRPIIIGNDGILISGIETFKAQQASQAGHLMAAVLDLEALWLERYSIEYIKLLYTERFAICARIEQLLDNHQGQGNALKRPNLSFKKNFELCLRGDEVQERRDQKIARVGGFKSKDAYHRVKQVCCLGIPELIKVLNNCQLSLTAAAKIAKLPKEQQRFQLMNKNTVQLKEKQQDFLSRNTHRDQFIEFEQNRRKQCR